MRYITALTVQASVIRLDMRLLDSAILNNKRIPLRAVAAKDRRAIKRQIQRLCEAQARVAKETDLVVNQHR